LNEPPAPGSSGHPDCRAKCQAIYEWGPAILSRLREGGWGDLKVFAGYWPWNYSDPEYPIKIEFDFQVEVKP